MYLEISAQAETHNLSLPTLKLKENGLILMASNMRQSVLKMAYFQLWSPILGLLRGCLTLSPQNNIFGHDHMS